MQSPVFKQIASSPSQDIIGHSLSLSLLYSNTIINRPIFFDNLYLCHHSSNLPGLYNFCFTYTEYWGQRRRQAQLVVYQHPGLHPCQ